MGCLIGWMLPRRRNGGKMQRFVLPAFFAMMLTAISAGAFGDRQLPLALSGRASAAPRLPLSGSVVPVRSVPVADNVEQQGARDAQDHRAADLQRQVNDLQGLVAQVKQQLEQRKAQRTSPDVAGLHAPELEAADLQRQDTELHSELQSLIAQLDQELQLEMQSPPAPDSVEQRQRQAARESLKNSIADLRQQDNELQGLMAQHGQQVAQGEAQRPSVPDVSEKQAARDALEHQVADLQHKIADLHRQDDVLQSQITEHRRELAQRSQELTQRAHDVDAARAEADKLRQDIDALRQQRQAEEGSPARQKTQERRSTVAEVTRPSPPAPTPPPMPSRQQQTQPMPTPQPMQPMPAVSASQQLQTAQQWLSAGRPDDARRLLAMVQTQVVFQSGTPERPDTQGRDSTVTDVGDAIRWLDMGAGGKAMQSIKHAIDDANSGGGTARAKPGNPAVAEDSSISNK
jgi:hypothetical protein